MCSIGWFPVFIQVSISISVRDIISQVQETFIFEVFVPGESNVAIPEALFTHRLNLARNSHRNYLVLENRISVQMSPVAHSAR